MGTQAYAYQASSNRLNQWAYTSDAARNLTGVDGAGHHGACVRFGGRLAAVAPDGSVYWHHNDQGAPQAMTDSTSAKVWEMSHAPFGIAMVNEDPDRNGIKVTNNFRFPGQYFDAETGLNYIC